MLLYDKNEDRLQIIIKKPPDDLATEQGAIKTKTQSYMSQISSILLIMFSLYLSSAT